MPRTILFAAVILLLYSCNNVDRKQADTPLTGASSQASIDSSQQVTVALSFINSYVDNCRKMGQATPVVVWVTACPLATAHYKSSLKKFMGDAYKAELVGPDADPVLDAQDFPDKGFELESVDMSEHYVMCRGRDWPDFKLCLKLTREQNKWLVDGCGMVGIPGSRKPKR